MSFQLIGVLVNNHDNKVGLFSIFNKMLSFVHNVKM